MGADPSPQTPTGSTYFALENEALKARVYELQALCARAADALEDNMNVNLDRDLIKELREASK